MVAARDSGDNRLLRVVAGQMTLVKAFLSTGWDWLKIILVNVGLAILMVLAILAIAVVVVIIAHAVGPIFSPFSAWFRVFVNSIAFPITVFGVMAAVLLILFGIDVADTYKMMKERET